METPDQKQASEDSFDLDNYRFLLERLQQSKRDKERITKKTAVPEPQGIT